MENRMLLSNYLTCYKPFILSLTHEKAVKKAELLNKQFLMERNRQIEMYYAPHNEYINASAKVMIIGLTPGWIQMRNALAEAKTCIQAGLSDIEVCKRAKQVASFSGPMRAYLITMLEALELHHYLRISSCETLFQGNWHMLHTTSLLRFPVFVAHKNYSGSNPSLLKNEYLYHKATQYIQEELSIVAARRLIIPLGKTVEGVLKRLVQREVLDKSKILWGFPHPSGANGNRFKQFAEHQEAMKRIIKQSL